MIVIKARSLFLYFRYTLWLLTWWNHLCFHSQKNHQRHFIRLHLCIVRDRSYCTVRKHVDIIVKIPRSCVTLRLSSHRDADYMSHYVVRNPERFLVSRSNLNSSYRYQFTPLYSTKFISNIIHPLSGSYKTSLFLYYCFSERNINVNTDPCLMEVVKLHVVCFFIAFLNE